MHASQILVSVAFQGAIKLDIVARLFVQTARHIFQTDCFDNLICAAVNPTRGVDGTAPTSSVVLIADIRRWI
jgi:hypothetical protein